MKKIIKKEKTIKSILSIIVFCIMAYFSQTNCFMPKQTQISKILGLGPQIERSQNEQIEYILSFKDYNKPVFMLTNETRFQFMIKICRDKLFEELLKEASAKGEKLYSLIKNSTFGKIYEDQRFGDIKKIICSKWDIDRIIQVIDIDSCSKIKDLYDFVVAYAEKSYPALFKALQRLKLLDNAKEKYSDCVIYCEDKL